MILEASRTSIRQLCLHEGAVMSQTQTYEMLCTKLMPQEERQDNIKRFQDDPKCRFLVGTPSTGGYGITLTAASTMIYYSNGYDLEKRQQSEARIDRIGQEKPMTYIDIICEDTVDERIVKALRKKINIATEIMGEQLKEWI